MPSSDRATWIRCGKGPQALLEIVHVAAPTRSVPISFSRSVHAQPLTIQQTWSSRSTIA